MQGSSKYNFAKALYNLKIAESSEIHDLLKAAELDGEAGDLVDMDLSNLDLSGQDLSGYDLRNVNFENAVLVGTNLKRAKVDPDQLLVARYWWQADLDEDLRGRITDRLSGDKIALRSFFRLSDVSAEERQNQMFLARLIEDVILGLLYANKKSSRPITFQNIADELKRLNLSGPSSSTYGRISRLRKKGHIAKIDPKNQGAYLLTAEGSAYASKMLAKRGLQMFIE